MKRIIWHWTAGGNHPTDFDKAHYHFLIDGAGKVYRGKWPVAANEKPVKGLYAAHTLDCNTGSIGVAVAAMAGAIERPFNPGPEPITSAQVAALVKLSRDLGKEFGIPVTPQTMLSHAEVQPTLGIKQRGKWDISWLPGMDGPGDPVAVGNKLRAMIKAQGAMVATPKPVRPSNAPPVAPKPPPVAPAPAQPAQGFWAKLFAALFGRT